MYASTTLVVFLAALTFSYAADTDITDADIQRVFNEFDCDHDGKLSQDETVKVFEAFGQDKNKADKEFKTYDKNGDKGLDLAEYTAGVRSGCCSVVRKPGAKGCAK